jgi:hypothetical protein
MVNYALLYGKTAFTLAKDIGVTQKEADQFIQAYFARYPPCARSSTRRSPSARKTGMVRTLLGRLRRLPDLNAKNFQVRMEAERQAMNTPVQGSAADLIKKAMIDLHHELRRAADGLAPHPADPRRAAAGGARRRGGDRARPGEGDHGRGPWSWTSRWCADARWARAGPRSTEGTRRVRTARAGRATVFRGGFYSCRSTSTSAPSAVGSS